MLGNPFRPEVVVRVRAGVAVDPYSQEASEPNWDDASEVPIVTLAPAEPRPSNEPVQDARNAVVSGYTLYLPAGSDITAMDRLRVRGVDYPVVGEPADWLGAGLVVQCSLTEG